MTIRQASVKDAAALQSLLENVFDDDPLIAWFVRHDDRRTPAFASFFDYMVNKYCLPHGECWVTESVSGAALWMPPGEWDRPFLEQLSSLFQTLGIFGFRHLLTKMQERRIIDRTHPKHPHYYLAALAVDPADRAKGVGSRLIHPILKRSDEEGVGCYLETSRERNIKFYERHGFSIMRKLTYSPDKLPLWCMWRSPNTRKKNHASSEQMPSS